MRAVTRDERRSSRAERWRVWRSVPYGDQKRIRDALLVGAAAANRALAGEPRYPADQT
jgi:hypothetical protein